MYKIYERLISSDGCMDEMKKSTWINEQSYAPGLGGIGKMYLWITFMLFTAIYRFECQQGQQ